MKKIIQFCFILICILFTSIKLQAQWVNTNMTSTAVNALVVSGANLFAGTNGGMPNSGAFISTDYGVSWSPVNTGFTNTNVYAFAVSGTYLFAGAYDGVFLSTNNGANWSSSGLTSKIINTLAISGADIFAGTADGLVYRSTNNGTDWTSASSGLHSNSVVYTLAVSGNNIFAGTNFGVYVSADSGASWSSAGLSGNVVSVLAFSGTNLYAGIFDGVSVSANNGLSWTTSGTGLTQQTDVRSLAFSGTDIFAGTWGDGVYLSTDNGSTWNSVNTTGLSGSRVHTLVISGTNLLAGIDDGLWRRPLSNITGIENDNASMPDNYSLFQNYPNPFNPATLIRYALPSESKITISIYNLLGQEIKSLVNGTEPAGYHEVNFNAGSLSSGVYFYRIVANSLNGKSSFTSTRKLILMK